ncbi:response regulator [Microbaculum marinum]|uniref:Response regulator n=1 Tax=Microbaculum marinum TaxID=1764581 RepID=A0AAW9RRU3_9HYPH
MTVHEKPGTGKPGAAASHGDGGAGDGVAADDGTFEDQAGIAALAELVANHPESAPALSVPLSALAVTSRRPGHGASALKPRVLLVEGNPVNRLLVGVLLERLGLEHVAVGCGEEAIYRFAREPFDAIMLDVAMDGLGGLATAKAMQMLVGDDMPPLVALGGADLEEDVLEAAGISAVAETPLDTNRIAMALIAAIERDVEDETAR